VSNEINCLLKQFANEFEPPPFVEVSCLNKDMCKFE